MHGSPIIIIAVQKIHPMYKKAYLSNISLADLKRIFCMLSILPDHREACYRCSHNYYRGLVSQCMMEWDLNFFFFCGWVGKLYTGRSILHSSCVWNFNLVYVNPFLSHSWIRQLWTHGISWMFVRSDSWGAGLSVVVWTSYANLLVNVPLSLRLNPKLVHYNNPWPHSSRS
jgi:hypothetical protein